MADELIALFGRITTTDHDQLVDQFSKIMQVDPHVSTFFLEASQWNVETAVHNYLASANEDSRFGRSSNPQPLTAPPQANFVGDLAPWQSRPFQPGTKLPIRLRFHNVGQTAWPGDSRLCFVDGERMGGMPEIAIKAGPGETAEAILVLTVPGNEGTHMGSWRLACSAGYFGEPLYMIISASQAAEPVHFPPSEFGAQYQGLMMQGGTGFHQQHQSNGNMNMFGQVQQQQNNMMNQNGFQNPNPFGQQQQQMQMQMQMNQQQQQHQDEDDTMADL